MRLTYFYFCYLQALTSKTCVRMEEFVKILATVIVAFVVKATKAVIVKMTSMSAVLNHAKMEQHVMILWVLIPVIVLLVLKVTKINFYKE